MVVAKGGANSITHRAGVPSWHGTPGLAELGVSITGSLLLLGFSLEDAQLPSPSLSREHRGSQRWQRAEGSRQPGAAINAV